MFVLYVKLLEARLMFRFNIFLYRPFCSLFRKSEQGDTKIFKASAVRYRCMPRTVPYYFATHSTNIVFIPSPIVFCLLCYCLFTRLCSLQYIMRFAFLLVYVSLCIPYDLHDITAVFLTALLHLYQIPGCIP